MPSLFRISAVFLTLVLIGVLIGAVLAMGSPSAIVARADASPRVVTSAALPTPKTTATVPLATPSSSDPVQRGLLNPRPEHTLLIPPLPTRVPTPDPWRGQQQMNILVLGLDRRPGETISRTDSIMLVHVDLQSGTAGVLSIPRDLMVEIPGYGQSRINSAYPFGEANGQQRGIATLEATLMQNFQLTVDHYVAVDFDCFRGLVDGMGGATVDVPAHILDDRYPTDDYGFKQVEFFPGVQTLDGERALEYARTRHADSDFGRMRRQQQLLFALREQLLRPQALGAIPGITNACWDTQSDLSIPDLVALGLAARKIDAERINAVTLDENVARPYLTREGAAVLLPDWDAVRARVASVFPVAGMQTVN